MSKTDLHIAECNNLSSFASCPSILLFKHVAHSLFLKFKFKLKSYSIILITAIYLTKSYSLSGRSKKDHPKFCCTFGAGLYFSPRTKSLDYVVKIHLERFLPTALT